jgi:1-acyl-sn-glycerol-3-phosphate acyltransferase
MPSDAAAPEVLRRPASAAVVLRSAAFNAAFYVTTAILLIGTLPLYLILPQWFAVGVVRVWAELEVWLLRVIAGTRLEVRGRENLPADAAIVAVKHQSAFETFAIVPLLRFPTIVMKQSIRRIPIFGLYTIKSGMIHVDREGKTAALRALTERAKEEAAKHREIIIFPEGTRRPPGAEPQYQTGIALLYRSLGVPVVPVALNSGLFWPRKSFLHYPGTIVVEFLPAIPPGLDSRAFLTALEGRIEPAANRLLAEATGSRDAGEISRKSAKNTASVS